MTSRCAVSPLPARAEESSSPERSSLRRNPDEVDTGDGCRPDPQSERHADVADTRLSIKKIVWVGADELYFYKGSNFLAVFFNLAG
jgi:hypothetical protein